MFASGTVAYLLLSLHSVYCSQLSDYVKAKNIDGVKDILFHTKGGKSMLTTLDKDGTHPLDLAVTYLQEDMVELFLVGGAKPEMLNRYGFSTLHRVAANDEPRMLSLLLIRCDQACLETRDVNGETALLMAVRERLAENVKFLLMKKASVDAVNLKNQTVMHVLALSGCDEEIFQELRKRGASMDAADADGNTPAILATKTEYGNQYILEAVLDEGVDPNAVNSLSEGRNTALHYAVMMGHGKMVEDLLQCDVGTRNRAFKPKIDMPNGDGETQLALAMKSGNEKIKKAFREYIKRENLSVPE